MIKTTNASTVYPTYSHFMRTIIVLTYKDVCSRKINNSFAPKLTTIVTWQHHMRHIDLGQVWDYLHLFNIHIIYAHRLYSLQPPPETGVLLLPPHYLNQTMWVGNALIKASTIVPHYTILFKCREYPFGITKC